ncbi:hypothetical protein ACFVUS_28445 [Nocardia sp. NPDC058058]|uniref:hypothetical protein n=1 Tax=Nocardia sp. NPDC058058 TaxID=3346317 RepID=UPI0036D8C8D1
MVSKEIVVTVGEEDWRTLIDAAEAAGMSVEAYASWCIRIIAVQARPGGGKRAGELGQAKSAKRASERDDESESAAWAETFSERLSNRTDRRTEP